MIILKNDKKYKTIDLARIYDIHPNTIRLYEKLGYISTAIRKNNNYREFNYLHFLQLRICRYIFGFPFTTQCIRKLGNKVMFASATKQWKLAEKYVYEYIELIGNEYNVAKDTARILQNWINLKKQKISSNEDTRFTRKEVAKSLSITVETIRNWERNNLFNSTISSNNSKLYDNETIERIQVIYMLRQTGYSISSILNSLSMFDIGNTDMVVTALNISKSDELISVGDRWLYELSRLLNAAKKIPPIFDEIKNL